MIISLEKYYTWKKERYANQYRWKKKFAWIPIRLDKDSHTYLWLETFYRRKDPYNNYIYRTKDEHLVSMLKYGE